MGAALSGRLPPPPGAVVVEIESDAFCTTDPCTGRSWPAVAKPSFVVMSEGEWSDFVESMGVAVKRYKKEGRYQAAMIFAILLSTAIFHPTIGLVGRQITFGSDDREDFMEEEDGDTRRRRIGPRLAYGMGILMVFIIGSAVIGITCIFKARRYNQQVDAEIDRRLQSLSGERSGANFTLARSMTQPCKPKGARTYRALVIAPASIEMAVATAFHGAVSPDAPMANVVETTVTLQVAAPPGSKPGDSVGVFAPDGRQCAVVIPDGVAPGDVFNARLAVAAMPVATAVGYAVDEKEGASLLANV